MVFNRRTFVALAAISAAAISVPALAAPPIAYTKEAGTKYEVYLTNPNGSGTVKLFTSAARNAIGVLDMNPTANEIAIAESRATGFKIIRYTDAGLPGTVTTFDDGCYVRYLDYHPSDGSLLVNRQCLNPQTVEIRVWRNGAYQDPILSTDGMNDSYSQVRWLGDGSGFLVAYSGVGIGARIQRRNILSPSAYVDIWSSSNMVPPSFDVARCQGAPLANCSKLLYVGATIGVHELAFSDFGGGTDTLVLNSTVARYSPDNSRMLYRTEVKGGYTLNVTAPAATTATKGGYLTMDWRP